MTDVLSPTVFYIISGVLVLGVLVGLCLMSKPKTARAGNAISAISAVAAIAVTMYAYGALTAPVILGAIAVGAVISLFIALKVKMIQMPQLVALLNGFGGLSSALVAVLSFKQANDKFSDVTSVIALIIGFVTFTGSLVAAGKLHKILPQKPIVIKGHTFIVLAVLAATAVSAALGLPVYITGLLAALFGIVFSVRVGGADMPITISLLNSLSGVAGGIAGIAVGNIILVAVGGIVGASGLLLTQIMCRAMNRKLLSILIGGAPAGKAAAVLKEDEKTAQEAADGADADKPALSPGEILGGAKKIIIIPGYGMALAQAQSKVKMLADKLEEKGAEVKFAIHPVAGRMPGHMNVLLCEVDVPYDKLYEMEVINPEFADCDAVIVVGANDVINPAANTAEGTPIYGMPVLDAAAAKHVIVCNFDEKPGYAGVENPLYKRANTLLLLGDAKETVSKLIDCI